MVIRCNGMLVNFPFDINISFLTLKTQFFVILVYIKINTKFFMINFPDKASLRVALVGTVK